MKLAPRNRRVCQSVHDIVSRKKAGIGGSLPLSGLRRACTVYMDTKKELDWLDLFEEAVNAPGNVGDTYNRFYDYSYSNIMLLRAQGVREPVANYNRWRTIGRQVLRGSKAKAVIHPVIEREETEGGIVEEFRGYRLRNTAFTYSQTTGEEPPARVIPGWDVERMLINLGISHIPFDHIDGNTQGFSRGHNIAINPVAKFVLKTTIHEASHIVGGHTAAEQVAEYATHRGLYELEAETPTYLAMKELGIMTEEEASVSRGYIDSWVPNLSDLTNPVKTIRRIFRTTETILRAGREPAV